MKSQLWDPWCPEPWSYSTTVFKHIKGKSMFLKKIVSLPFKPKTQFFFNINGRDSLSVPLCLFYYLKFPSIWIEWVQSFGNTKTISQHYASSSSVFFSSSLQLLEHLNSTPPLHPFFFHFPPSTSLCLTLRLWLSPIWALIFQRAIEVVKARQKCSCQTQLMNVIKKMLWEGGCQE